MISMYDTMTWGLEQNIGLANEHKSNEPSEIRVIDFSQDGKLMVVGMGSGLVYVYQNGNHEGKAGDVKALPIGKPSWKPLHVLKEHTKRITCFSFIGKKCLLSGSRDSKAIFWELDTGTPVKKISPNFQPVNTCAVSSKGLIAIGTVSSPSARPQKNVALSFWNTNMKCIRREWLITYTSDEKGNPNSVIYHDVTAVDFSPDGEILAACLSCALWIFETRSFSRMKKIELPGCCIPSCTFSSSGDYLVFSTTRMDLGWSWEKSGGDRELQSPAVWIYCGKDFKKIKYFHGHRRIIMSCDVAPDERTIASVSKNVYAVDQRVDSNVRLWDMEAAKEEHLHEDDS